ncbi:hypothetical protein IWW51_002029 [Coemansia sp. RSA 2702]|nr:hypothetical protein IWW51_002029 [Coemansia sp. RSA 2702]
MLGGAPSASMGSLPNNGGGNPPSSANRGMYWSQVNARNTRIPGDAVLAGKYGDQPVFIGRTSHKGNVEVGMVTMEKGGLVVVYDGKPALFREYEVLCGPQDKYRWIDASGRLDFKDIRGGRPLACGHDQSGDLYAARTLIHDRAYVGKVSVKTKGMIYAHKGDEERAKKYSVLCGI